MPKYSIIIPVYNTEEYLEKCLNSVVNQTYKNFEVIIVNDGTEDNSQSIIDKYTKKYKFIKCIIQENQGLSIARNNGIKKACGKYFLLLDSDDYLDNKLLEVLDSEVQKNEAIDLIRFQIRNITDKIKEYHEKPFYLLPGHEAFQHIVKYHYIENACCYLYNREFFQKNNFKYKANIYHEDFGLTPIVIEKANLVSSIDFLGYNYVERKSSIMTSQSYDKVKKKVNDFYGCYLYLMKEIGKIPGDHKVFKSYLANSLIIKILELNKKDYKKYFKKLKKDHVFDNVLANTFTRKIKKIIILISPKLYYRRTL